MAIDWYAIASLKGYETPNAMLKELYWDRKMTMAQVGEALQTSSWAVWAALRKFNVSIRPRGGLRVKRQS